jgi:hypothetical protein
MNVELSETEPLPARSDKRRRRIRKIFTSDELAARSRTQHSITMLVLWDDIAMKWQKRKKQLSRWNDEVGKTLRNGQQKQGQQASSERDSTLSLSLSLSRPAS